MLVTVGLYPDTFRCPESDDSMSPLVVHGEACLRRP
jgi:hypothetical protein